MNRQNQHKPFHGKNNLFVEVRPYSFVVGEILDINMSGLSFCYRHHGNQLKEFFEINLWKDNRPHVGGITVKKISNLVITNRNHHDFNEMRQCKVQFLELTSNQQSRIKHVARKYV